MVLLTSPTVFLFHSLLIFVLILICCFFLLAFSLVYSSFASSLGYKITVEQICRVGSTVTPGWVASQAVLPRRLLPLARLCSGRAAGRPMQSDKSIGCALQSGKTTRYASKLGRN